MDKQDFTNFSLRKAEAKDLPHIWPIFEQAIAKRREEGSSQWQDGYPNPNSIEADIQAGHGYVCLDGGGKLIAYLALIFTGEPAYEALEGQWLSTLPFAVVHRVAVRQQPHIKGLASWLMQAIEPIVLAAGFQSIKVDTNFDNAAMLRILEKLGYTYCGEVYFRGSARKAFEKLLTK